MESHLPPDSLNSAAPANAAAAASNAANAAAAVSLGPSERSRREAESGLYVHVPFCAQRCNYCDFSTGAISSEKLTRYLRAIALEAGRRAPHAAGVRFTSVFFGGGTPSALAPWAFARLWQLLLDHFEVAPNAEITLEANPESVKPGLLEAWAKAGVNRLSMGAQSFDPQELAQLGRIHDAERPHKAFALARSYGFERLSLDLMFGFPGNGQARWAHSIARALELSPEHLSAYSFIPEPDTPIGEAVRRGHVELPTPDAQAEAYAHLTDALAQAGLDCYETCSFARPDGEVRHNLVYWLRRCYVGLGPSAHGLVNGVRYGNHYAAERWASALERDDDPESMLEPETDTLIALEVMMLGLRLSCGLDARDHPEAIWNTVERRYTRAFALAVATGRLERTAHGVRLAPKHRFIADDVIAWIEAQADRPRLTGATSAS